MLLQAGLYLLAVILGFISAFLSLFIYFTLFSIFTRDLDEIKAIKEGNKAVGLFSASILLSFILIISPALQNFLSFRYSYYLPAWEVVGKNIANAFATLFFQMIIAFISLYFAFWLLDRLTPSIDFKKHLQAGNLSLALFLSGFLIAFALIMKGLMSYLYLFPPF